MDEWTSWMKRALALARRGEGLTRPNPPVGAVLVQGGVVRSEGWHHRAGTPHAEVNCLQSIRGEIGADAVLYVSLEPCSTTGRTPPCTDLILERGIRRVVVGCEDPNPAHAGRGLDKLRRAGVEVVCGICREEAQRLIAPFAKRMLSGLPYVTLKLGATLDGRIADASGTSQWITGPAAREQVQALRRTADAIAVGAQTARADDPSLLPRPANGRHPWRVVVGSGCPPTARLLNDASAQQTLCLSSLPDGLRRLARECDVMHLLCEGGGELAGSLIRGGWVDEFVIFMAPSMLGGTGVPMFGRAGWPLAEMPRVVFQSVERCGDDVLIRAVPEKKG